MRVLIVEDERKLAAVLGSALQAEHYEVVVALTGQDGFAHATADAFDLVVLDLMLPGRTGLEAKNRLGAILDAAQREPIMIRRQDRCATVVYQWPTTTARVTPT